MLMLQEVMDIIYISIEDAVENLLPIEDLLNSCFAEDEVFFEKKKH